MGVAVVAAVAEEHAVEVDSFAVVVVDLSDFALEMVPRRKCYGLLAAVDTTEEVRSAVDFDCNTLQLDLPWRLFGEAVP